MATQDFKGTLNDYQIGTPTSPAYSAGDYTAAASMTWDVAEADVTTMRYMVVGKMMTILFQLDATTTGGTPADALKIAIPGGYQAAKAIGIPFGWWQAGVAVGVGHAVMAVDGTTISLYKDVSGGPTWNNSTNATYVSGSLTFEVK